MTLVARASKTVRLKNLIIVAMCLVFFGLFFWDGYYTYPDNNDRIVRQLAGAKDVSKATLDRAEKWTRWDKETPESRAGMNADLKRETGSEAGKAAQGWKSPFDVSLQRLLAWCLLGCVGASMWWLVHCQRRRAIAEEGTVSPAAGVVVPWGKITRVDNTRWKTVGIVEITYTDEAGAPRKAEFDDYKLEREPLLGILDELGTKAVNAEFIPKEEVKEESKVETNPDNGSPPQG